MLAAHHVFVALTAFAIAPALSFPQDTRPAPATDGTGEGFVIEAKEYSLEELVDRAAKFLNRNYLVQWTDTAGRKGVPTSVFVQRRMELDALGCEEVVSQMLYSCGWVMTPLDEGRGVYEFLHLQSQRRKEIQARPFQMSLDEINRRPGLKVYVSTTLDCDPSAVMSGLNDYIKTLDKYQLTAIPFDSRIHLIGFTDAVRTAAAMVEAIQAPGGQDK